MRYPVSLIVLYHSGKGLLKACLESLIATIQKDDEVIIVVNSPNPTDQEIDFVSPGSRYRIVKFDQALGHARAANEGAAVAKHDHLVFCDHDLVFQSGWLNALWYFYQSRQQLRAVSCCIINSHTNCILDFGIAYNEFNGAHPHLDLPITHPLVQKDRITQAICTGGMLISKSDFERLEGFDEKLMTLYSDVDLCLRLKALNYEVGSTPKAVAYHFGGCFSQIERAYKKSYLKADIKGYFSQKHAGVIAYDLSSYYQLSAQYFLENYAPFEKYFYCNLMNVANPHWYNDLFEDLGASYYDGVTWASGNRDSGQEGLYEHLGHDIACLRTPIAYFVDRFSALGQNALWWHRRKNSNDVIIDRNANIIPVNFVIKDKVTPAP